MAVTAKQISGWVQGFVTNYDGKNAAGRTVDGEQGYLQAVSTKGGAEGWAQVCLQAIFESLPGAQTVEREVKIFGDGKQVDFLISVKDEGYTAVELKCECLFTSAEEGRVTMPHTEYGRVLDDINKLGKIPLQSRGKAGQTNTIVNAYQVCITFSDYAASGLDKALTGLGCSFEKEPIDVKRSGKDYTICVYVTTVFGATG